MRFVVSRSFDVNEAALSSFLSFESVQRSRLFCVNVSSSKGSSFTVFFGGFDCGLRVYAAHDGQQPDEGYGERQASQ